MLGKALARFPPVVQNMLVVKMKRQNIEAEWIPQIFTPVEEKWGIRSRSLSLLHW